MPFTQTQFFEVFGAFNTAFPLVIAALWLVTLIAVVQVLRGAASTRGVLALAAVHWAWSGVAYHALFFSTINPAAWLFAAVFVAQAAAFGWLALRPGPLRFAPAWAPRGVVAIVLLVYSLIYPALAVAGAHDWPRAPIFGVPCPTTLFTAGLLLAAAPGAPRWLFVVPLLWSAIGGSAAVFFGVLPDLMLLAALAFMLGWGVIRRPQPAVHRPVHA